MTGRSIPEWIGKTPDTKVPPHVRQRVYDRYKGLCYLTGIAIAGKPWELEHIKPLHMGGEHRETNLAPALPAGHKVKSAAELKVKAKADRVARRASGSLAATGKKIESAGFRHSSTKRQANPTPALPPRAMFVDRTP